MSVDYSQFIAFRDKFERLSNEFETFLKQFLIKQALDVLAKTKRNSPVDTGLLRNSWTIGEVVRDGDVLKVTISNPVEYAKYVEYGHIDRSHSKWINGQFMCSLSIIDVKKKMPQRFQREFETWFASFNM
ncbi:bacteriophage protein, PF04883 family [Peptostreptococcaceae bacterium AS15]|nr:bacteriophage protein, PF04883 family [Peptostreptococcaceae bacterium AS15]